MIVRDDGYPYMPYSLTSGAIEHLFINVYVSLSPIIITLDVWVGGGSNKSYQVLVTKWWIHHFTQISNYCLQKHTKIGGAMAYFAKTLCFQFTIIGLQLAISYNLGINIERDVQTCWGFFILKITTFTSYIQLDLHLTNIGIFSTSCDTLMKL